MYSIKVDFNDSFFTKTKTDFYESALKESIEYVTNEFVNACKDEAPVRTGRLKDGHYARMDGLTGIVGNDVEYAPYVIYGTSRQAPNNYPSRVASRMNLSGTVSSRFQQSLITNGVLR